VLETGSIPGVPAPGDEESGPRGPQLVRFGLLFYGAMALVALLWRVLGYGEPILYASPAAEAEGVSLARAHAAGGLAGAGLLALSHLSTHYTSWGETLARSLAEAIGDLSLPGALTLALASGLAEEMLCRGALQPRVGWWIAGVLFGLVPFAPRRELLPWTGFAIVAGLLFGWLFEATGNLIAPVTAHVLVNAVNIPILVRRHRGEPG
jgi:membrane protease YdiL (CAAX protease family)